jgi:hypothetical protein
VFVAVDGFLEAFCCFGRIAGLEVFVAEREAEQGAVARAVEHFFQGFDAWVHGLPRSKIGF